MSKRIETILRRFVAEIQEAMLEDALELIAKRGSDALSKATPGAKRTPEEINKLTDNVYKRITTVGSRTIEELALGMGVTTKEMQLPLRKLRGQKLIRTTGKARAVRYHRTAT